MDHAHATEYDAVKAAILRRYEINKKTYRQRFRSAKRNTGEMQAELVIRLQDAARKWLKDCSTMDKVLDVIVLIRAVCQHTGPGRSYLGERAEAADECRSGPARGRLRAGSQAARASTSEDSKASRWTQEVLLLP